MKALTQGIRLRIPKGINNHPIPIIGNEKELIEAKRLGYSVVRLETHNTRRRENIPISKVIVFADGELDTVSEPNATFILFSSQFFD